MAVFELNDLIQDFSFDTDTQSLESSLKIAPDLLAFDGHFPGEPILPGIVQLSMARELVEKALGGLVDMTEIHRARMSDLILPEDEIQMKIKLSEEGEKSWRAKVSVLKGAKTASRFNFLVQEQA